MNEQYPILEFDNALPAAIEPGAVIDTLPDMPERVVFCFFQKAIEAACGNGNAEIIYHLGSEIGRNPVYRLEHNGSAIAVTHPGVGAPLAAFFLEETIALGGKKFMACGGAGVLDSTIGLGHVVVPKSAIRDEGTSYHYLPPSREVAASPEAVEAIEATLAKHGVPYDLGKTWTTDAIYRETPNKIKKRRAEGAMTVEMEAATFFAIAQFRGVPFGQMLYGGDDVGADAWDSRDWFTQHSTREKLFWLAVEAVQAL